MDSPTVAKGLPLVELGPRSVDSNCRFPLLSGLDASPDLTTASTIAVTRQSVSNEKGEYLDWGNEELLNTWKSWHSMAA